MVRVDSYGADGSPGLLPHAWQPVELPFHLAESCFTSSPVQAALAVAGSLAGRDKVQTFLALLNQQAVASGVQMQRYEPLNTPPPSQGQSRRNNKRSKAKQKAEQPQDPLQALGYRKTSVALEVSGSFDGLQTFLRRMEALELLVESSDLSLQASSSEKTNAEMSPKRSATKLTLQLSFYDLLPEPAEGSSAAGSNKEPA